MGNDQSSNKGAYKPLLQGERQSQKSISLSQAEQQSYTQIVSQTQQMSAEEMRKRRIEKMEKKNAIPQRISSTDFENHPIAQEHGKKAYLIHMLFEDIYRNTFHKTSIQRNPGLKLLQTQNKKKEFLFYTLENFDIIVPEILESNMFYTNDEKVEFLIGVSLRVKEIDKLDILSETQKAELQKSAIILLINYLSTPVIYSPEINQEDWEVLTDCSCVLHDCFYDKLSSLENEEFLVQFLANLPHEEYNAILTPILKRIMRNSLERKINDVSKNLAAINLLTNLLSKGENIVDFFVNHQFYLPKSAGVSGIDFQNGTIFGACLSYTVLVEESSSAMAYFYDKGKKKDVKLLTEIREKVHRIIESVHNVMELMIKVNQKYKKYILDWIYYALLINNSKHKITNIGGVEASTNGWFSNFIVLLLKFCQKMLEDPNTYTNWLSKIDISYIQERVLFDKILLLNGQNNIVTNRLDCQNVLENPSIKPKFTFLTELIFLTSHALLLNRNITQNYLQFAPSFGLRHQNENAEIIVIAQNNVDLEKYYGYYVHFHDPYQMTLVMKLFSFKILLILHSYFISVKTLDMVHHAFEQIESLQLEYFEQKPSLPLYWAENVYEYINFISLLEPNTLTQFPKCFEMVMDFMLCIKKDKWMNFSHVKANSLTIFTNFKVLEQAETVSKKGLHSPFIENPFFERHLVNTFVQSFIEAEELHTQHDLSLKFKARIPICSTLDYLLTNVFPMDRFSYVVKGLDRLIIASHDTYCLFFNFYLEDLTFLVNHSLLKVKELRDSNQSFATSPYSSETISNTINLIFSNFRPEIRDFLVTLREYLSFLLSVSKVFPEFLLNTVIQDRLAQCLNMILKILTGSQITELDVPVLQSKKCSPRTFLQIVLQIFINLSEHQVFISKVVNLENDFSLKDFESAAQISEGFSLLRLDETAKLLNLIQKLEIKKLSL